MKKFIALAIVSLAALGLAVEGARADHKLLHCCKNKCGPKCTQYNAFSPPCCPNPCMEGNCYQTGCGFGSGSSCQTGELTFGSANHGLSECGGPYVQPAAYKRSLFHPKVGGVKSIDAAYMAD